MRAWRAADRYDSGRPLRPWLFAILRNVITDAQRARSARATPRGWRRPGRVGPGARGGSDEIDGVLDQCVLHEALLRIRDDQRTVLVETYYRGRSYADVAAELGIPEPTARTRAFYGLRALEAGPRGDGVGRVNHDCDVRPEDAGPYLLGQLDPGARGAGARAGRALPGVHPAVRGPFGGGDRPGDGHAAAGRARRACRDRPTGRWPRCWPSCVDTGAVAGCEWRRWRQQPWSWLPASGSALGCSPSNQPASCCRGRRVRRVEAQPGGRDVGDGASGSR